MATDPRKRILGKFSKIGTMFDVCAYEDPNRTYSPIKGYAVGLYLAQAKSKQPVKDVRSFDPSSPLGQICKSYVNPPLQEGEEPWVGCLLVGPEWNAGRVLASRDKVQLQAFDNGLIAVPSAGSFIAKDGGDKAKLIAITMALDGDTVVSTLHWLKANGDPATDTWKWPD